MDNQPNSNDLLPAGVWIISGAEIFQRVRLVASGTITLL
jgi:hypothetical protein